MAVNLVGLRVMDVRDNQRDDTKYIEAWKWIIIIISCIVNHLFHSFITLVLPMVYIMVK